MADEEQKWIKCHVWFVTFNYHNIKTKETVHYHLNYTDLIAPDMPYLDNDMVYSHLTPPMSLKAHFKSVR